MKVSVDFEICAGHGVCWGLAPEVFVITDDGYARVVVDEVPAGSEAAVRTSAAQCPEKAISVEE